MSNSKSAVDGLSYPNAKKSDVVDEFHGTQVPDPYRWLEDSSTDDTKAWIAAENAVTEAYLAKIPSRKRIHDRMEKLWNYDKYGLPVRESGRYFFFKREGLQNQSVLHWQDGADSDSKVLLDSNKLSEDGTTSVSGFAISRDGKLCAYSISEGGSDWRKIRVRNVDTGEDLDDLVEWAKFTGIAWANDGSGFYYSRYDAPEEGKKLANVNKFHKLYFHRIGDSQDKDVLIYQREDREKWGFGGHETRDGKFLIVEVWEGTSPKNGVFFKSLESESDKVVELRNKFEAGWNFIHNVGSVFYFVTDLDAPRGRLVSIDTSDSSFPIQEVIPQSEATLEAVKAVGGRFVASYLKDAKSVVKIYSLDGGFEKDLELPAMGSVSSLSGKPDTSDFFYAFTSFTYPTTIFRYDTATDEQSVLRKPDIDFDASPFEIKQVFYASKDGTQVPMFIVHKRGLELDGSNPTYLYGYGGFNISLTPSFSVANVVWLEMGGVYAMPNLRGGGEYGEEWHEAGTKTKKQNVFDDFISAAEWLISEGYTSKKKIAIGGRSNGGLLVGASITQRPDLFRAALPGVGVLDMLRFHKFTIGWAWVSDYGTPDNADEFAALHAYSPYHNVKARTAYPSTLVTTADHDDRVVPAHSYKFTAAMQEAQAGLNPILISIDTKAGHGAGKPTAKVIEEWADNWGFLSHELGMQLPGDFGKE